MSPNFQMGEAQNRVDVRLAWSSEDDRRGVAAFVTNLLDDQQERARRLILQLVEHHRRQTPVARGPADETPEFDKEQLERLESLGYIK